VLDHHGGLPTAVAVRSWYDHQSVNLRYAYRKHDGTLQQGKAIIAVRTGPLGNLAERLAYGTLLPAALAGDVVVNALLIPLLLLGG
jgi:hypothetical protein